MSLSSDAGQIRRTVRILGDDWLGYLVLRAPEFQRTLAERFASKTVDRFAGVAWHEGVCGAPLLDGAATVFECFNRSRYEEGDHVIFIGEVERCRVEPGATPLIFHGGRYFTELPL